ncbi:inner ear-specific collagen-like [Ruditapes philippinarum]|uniref:inner ear-specific collagen-like n=1 Tax=Ruditapes philippinarum TaxID=129788 RepID=UPI00295A62BC|nr:inner ear-specific collagen-like [Ruditapes philippinarum]
MLTLKVFISVCVILLTLEDVLADNDETKDVKNLNGISRATLEEIVLGMSDKIKSLERKVDKLGHLEDKVSSLAATVALKSEKIEELEREIKRAAVEENGAKETVSVRAEVNNGNPADRSPTKNKIRGIRQVENVAFSAVMSHAVKHLGDKQTIKFDNVLLNDGHGYEPNTGVFTAPLSGTYLFTYNFGHHGTGETWLELVKNGGVQNGAAVEGHFGEQNLQGGNAAIIKVNRGDTVWVETFQVPDVTAQGTFTTFSGAFLY